MKFDLNIFSILIGLIGIVLSIYTFIKSKKIKKLAVDSDSTILISESLNTYENLKISYNNEDIKSLTSSIIKIKNIGTDIVISSDIAPSTPIVIKTTEKFLLNDISQYEINVSNNKSTVKLSKLNENSLQVLFDFLNPKDEISITILHTGDIYVEGDLMTTTITNHTRKNKFIDTDTLGYNEIYDKINETQKVISKFAFFIAMLIALILYIFSNIKVL